MNNRGLFMKTGWLGWVVFTGSLIVVFIMGVVITSVMERRAETRLLPQAIVPIPEGETDPALWGKNFPREYDRFLLTADTTGRTKYGGSYPFSHLERDTLLAYLWAGYPFAIEYNEDRGHQWALLDVRKTGRRDPGKGGKPGTGACMTCKTADAPGLMEEIGVAGFYATPFAEVDARVRHSIGCSDCHDPKTMALVITRPALREALVSMGKNPDSLSHQEMRSLVCAQCHSEYFMATGSYLTFPWKYGLSPEAMERFYDEAGFADWVHADSKARMIKMQHPDYEMFTTGIHAFSGLACPDCHMPYMAEGGVKFTDHYIQSPLNNIGNTCVRCHEWDEDETRARVETIQDNNQQLLQRAELALVAAHREIVMASGAGATDEQLARARALVRSAQLRWDYVSANNGMGFHSPQEAARILATSIDLAHQARESAMQCAKKEK